LANRLTLETSVVKRSIRIAGHRTSVSLEAEFWDELKEIAEKSGVSISQVVSEIDAGRQGNLSSAIRIFVLKFLKSGNA